MGPAAIIQRFRDGRRLNRQVTDRLKHHAPILGGQRLVKEDRQIAPVPPAEIVVPTDVLQREEWW